MSTLQTAARCRKSESGVTVVELLVAVVIMGLVALLVSVPVQMTKRLSKTALDAAMDTVDSNLALRGMAKQISSSQLIRSGLLRCTGHSKIISTEGTASFEVVIPEDGSAVPVEDRRFTIPFSSGQTIGSIDQNDNNRIQVTDSSFLQPGDLVVLVNTEDSSKIGAFQIDRIGVEQNKPFIVIKSPSIGDLDSECTIDSSVSLSANEMVEGISSSGQRGVFVQSLSFAKYQVEGNKLMMQAYPRAKDFNFVAFDKIRRLKIQSWWYGSKEGEAAPTYEDGESHTSGTFITRIDVTLREASFVGEYDDKGNPVQGFIDKPYSTYARYVMTANKKMNKAAVTNAIPQKTLFPTCYVVADTSGFTLDPTKSGLPVRESMIRLTGKMSDAVGAYTMKIGIEAGSGADVICMNQTDWQNSDKKGNAPKFRNSDFDLTGSPTATDIYLCSAKGKVIFTGTVSYYDRGLGKNQMITCRDSVGSITKATYSVETKPTCNRNGGLCVDGRLFSAKLSDYKQTFIDKVDSKTCEYEGLPSGDTQVCCDPILNPNVKLKQVKFKPRDGIVVDNPDQLTVTCKN